MLDWFGCGEGEEGESFLAFQYLGLARNEWPHGYSEAFLKTASHIPEEIVSAGKLLLYEIVIKRWDKRYELPQLTLAGLMPLWGC